MAEEQKTVSAAAMPRSNMAIPERFANPEDAGRFTTNANAMPYALCAIVAAILFALMAFFLWIDYSQLSAA